MAATTTSTFARKASNLASSAFTTTGSSTSSTKGAFPPNHCPNKLQLQCRLRESLGHGLPSTVTQRKLRAPAATLVPLEVRVHSPNHSIIPSTTHTLATIPEPLAASANDQPWRKIVEAPSPSMLPTPYFGRPYFPDHSSRVKIFEAPSPSMLPTPDFGHPHHSQSPRKMVSEAPSPSMLPTPPDFDRPCFPHRRSRTSAARKASEQGIARLFALEEDAIVSPWHLELNVESSSFRRTPGAPQGRKAFTQSGETGHAARIGLGLMVAGQSFLPVV
ncbi:hypothetical protein C8Q74DRAFT_1373769 [Fomes fomentarius]|nr:hypothetical protein C8Q74DRAFT_1373769 [Fomes fomentarius]